MRCSGYVKGRLDFLLALDESGNNSASDDTRHHELLLGGQWRKCAIVMDIREKSAFLSLGLYPEGRGRGWLDDCQWEVAGKDVPATGVGLGSEADRIELEAARKANAARPEAAKRAQAARIAQYAGAPVNLDFEGKR